MHLHLQDRPEGSVSLRAWDAWDAPIELVGRKITQTNGLAGIAVVSNDFRVRALPEGVLKGGGLELYLDGQKTTNYCSVRVLPNEAHLLPDVEVQGRYVSIWFPGGSVPTQPAFENLEGMCADYAFARTLDEGYEAMWETYGTAFADLGRQFVGALYVKDGGGACTGNPLCCDMDPVTGCNTLRTPQGPPHPGLVFHEMSHMFAGRAEAQRTIFEDPYMGSVFGEAITNFGAAYTLIQVRERLRNMGMLGRATAYLDSAEVHASIPWAYKTWIGDNLKPYMDKGARFPEDFHGGVAVGMFMDIAERYGWGYYRRFYSIFYPPDEPIPFSPQNREERITFLFAALSAATGHDLRPDARGYGMPIVDAVFEQTLPMLTWRATQRDDE